MLTDTQFINNIFAATEAFRTGPVASYQAWAAGNSFNSNSLVAGVLQAAGADVSGSLIPAIAPRFDQPVPITIPEFHGTSPDAPAGGFVLYPSKLNTNSL